MREKKPAVHAARNRTATAELASLTRRYSGGGDGRCRKNAALPFEKVTPLDGYGNFGGIYDQSNGP